MSMSQAPRLARIFTPTYAALVNAQIVSPAQHQVVKPNELASALMRPLQTSVYEPHRSPAYLAATLSYGIIQGHPFLDGNKRTANEYLRAHGLPGLADEGRVGRYEDLLQLAEHHVDVAAGRADLEAFTRDK